MTLAFLRFLDGDGKLMAETTLDRRVCTVRQPSSIIYSAYDYRCLHCNECQCTEAFELLKRSYKVTEQPYTVVHVVLLCNTLSLFFDQSILQSECECRRDLRRTMKNLFNGLTGLYPQVHCIISLDSLYGFIVQR